MGNDIKLPSTKRNELDISQISLQNESKEHLVYEIDKISKEVTAIKQQIDQIEHNLKVLSGNIDYYKHVVSKTSKILYNLEAEQGNASLSLENYKDKREYYTEILSGLNEVDPNGEVPNSEYFVANIENLKTTRDLLDKEIATNAKIITNLIEQLSSNSHPE